MECDLLYQSMSTLRRGQGRPELPRGTITRRAVLKALVGSGAAVVTGAGAYGFFDERHALGLTEAVVPVTGLPPELAGLKVGLRSEERRVGKEGRCRGAQSRVKK